MSKNYQLLFRVLFCLLFFFSFSVKAEELTIITGSKTGTYYQIANNLKELGEKNNFLFRVQNSKGSLENLVLTNTQEKIHLGFVQFDVLDFVRYQLEHQPDAYALRNIQKETKLLFPLYNEEIHILGRKGLEKFEDLHGKRVAIGAIGSGTNLTSTLLFQISSVTPKRLWRVGGEEAISMLTKGKIDAMFYVVGFPTRLFQDFVNEFGKYKLIPIKHQKILKIYTKTLIPAKTYPWQEKAIETASVKSILIARADGKETCEEILRFKKLVESHLPWLRENGHPKWKEVNLSTPMPNLESLSCK